MQYDILVKVIFIVINTYNFTFRKQTYFLSKVYYDGATLKISYFFDFVYHPIFKIEHVLESGSVLTFK
jgi:hypothetical protein